MSVLSKELRLAGHHRQSPDEKMKILNKQMSTLNEELNILNEELAALDRKHVDL
jgi:plasmid stability protein